MNRFLERAYGPSFLLFPAFFFALLTSILASYFNYWSGIACLLLVLCFGLPGRIVWSYLSIVVFTFCIVVIGNLYFIDKAYTAEDFYYIAYFSIGFIVFSKLSLRQTIHIYKLLVYLFILLAIWALTQYYTGKFYIVSAGFRSNTIFTTPNTFAAAINLILLPLIVVNLFIKNRPALFSVMLLLFSALLVTRSRGGEISFFVGMSVILVFVYVNKIQQKMQWKKVSIGLVSVLIFFIISDIFDWQTHRDKSEFDFFELTRIENISDHANHRLVLYDVAWQRIKEKPLLGHGYNNFQFYWVKDQRPPFKNTVSHFVHNDFLQLWMEAGMVGLLSILSIIALFYYQVWCYFRHNDSDSIFIVLALIGGLSAYFAHAMVDFVIYPCFLTLLFGAYLGAATQILSTEKGEITFLNRVKNRISQIGLNIKFWQIFVCVLLIMFLSQPYIAELAIKQAKKYTNDGEVVNALPFYELARRFAPYNADYYSLQGLVWRWSVMYSNRGAKTAEFADELLDRGSKANPYDVHNLLLRATLNRDYPDLLDMPASHETILNWLEYVLYWSPELHAGQYEYVKTLHKFGNKDLAKDLLEKYILLNPDYNNLVDLKNELEF